MAFEISISFKAIHGPCHLCCCRYFLCCYHLSRMTVMEAIRTTHANCFQSSAVPRYSDVFAVVPDVRCLAGMELAVPAVHCYPRGAWWTTGVHRLMGVYCPMA